MTKEKQSCANCGRKFPQPLIWWEGKWYCEGGACEITKKYPGSGQPPRLSCTRAPSANRTGPK